MKEPSRFSRRAAAILQPRFKAGSTPDLLSELILLPGKLAATPFPFRGDASPEFLWFSRIATAILFSCLAYWALGRWRAARNPSTPD